MFKKSNIVFMLFVCVCIWSCDNSKSPLDSNFSDTESLDSIQLSKSGTGVFDVQINFNDMVFCYRMNRSSSGWDHSVGWHSGYQAYGIIDWSGILNGVYYGRGYTLGIYPVCPATGTAMNYWFIKFENATVSPDYNETFSYPYGPDPGSKLIYYPGNGTNNWEISLGQVIDITWGPHIEFNAYTFYCHHTLLGRTVDNWYPRTLGANSSWNVQYLLYEIISDDDTFPSNYGSNTQTISLRDYSYAINYREEWPAAGLPPGTIEFEVIGTEPGVANYPYSTGDVTVESSDPGIVVSLTNVSYNLGEAKIIVDYQVSAVGQRVD